MGGEMAEVRQEQPAPEIAPELTNGEVVLVGGTYFKVRRGVRDAGDTKTIKLEPTGDGRMSRAPWRVVRMTYQKAWVPAIVDDRGKVVALVFGRDEEQQNANAVAMLHGYLYHEVKANGQAQE